MFEASYPGSLVSWQATSSSLRKQRPRIPAYASGVACRSYNADRREYRPVRQYVSRVVSSVFRFSVDGLLRGRRSRLARIEWGLRLNCTTLTILGSVAFRSCRNIIRILIPFRVRAPTAEVVHHSLQQWPLSEEADHDDEAEHHHTQIEQR